MSKPQETGGMTMPYSRFERSDSLKTETALVSAVTFVAGAVAVGSSNPPAQLAAVAIVAVIAIYVAARAYAGYRRAHSKTDTEYAPNFYDPMVFLTAEGSPPDTEAR
jgi:hypothetical protein